MTDPCHILLLCDDDLAGLELRRLLGEQIDIAPLFGHGTPLQLPLVVEEVVLSGTWEMGVQGHPSHQLCIVTVIRLVAGWLLFCPPRHRHCATASPRSCTWSRAVPAHPRPAPCARDAIACSSCRARTPPCAARSRPCCSACSPCAGCLATIRAISPCWKG